MKKLFVWAVILFALTACGDIQPIAEIEQSQPAESQKITLTATIRAGAPATKVLKEESDRIEAKWKEGETIALIYKEDGTEKKVIATVTSVDDNGVATITASLEGEFSGSVSTTIIYPESAVGHYPSTSAPNPKYRVKDNLLQSQNGTLTNISTYLDVRTGTANMVIDNVSKVATFQGGDVKLENQNCILKFTLNKVDGNNTTALQPSSFVITIDAKDYTITPADPTKPLYVALPSIFEKAVSFKATSSEVKYYFSKEAVTLIASNYYESTLTMSTDIGLLPGKFSVAAGKQVQFSKGNLQWFYGKNTHKVKETSNVTAGTQDRYHYNGGIFTFANHQWDICASNNDGYDRGGDMIVNNIGSYTASKKIDLFMYATSGYHYKNKSDGSQDEWNYHYKPFAIRQGAYLKYDPFDYQYGPIAGIAGSESDWGVFNTILNGGDEKDIWRTLTKDEWAYLLNERADASSKIGVGIVHGCHGVILLPDDWTSPGVSFVSIAAVNTGVDAVKVTKDNKTCVSTKSCGRLL